MKGILILYKKEIKDQFSSPMIYMMAGIFSLIMGFLFFNLVLGARELTEVSTTNSVLRPVYGFVNVMMMFFVPILTMRSFSEEFRDHTADLLFISKLKDYEIYFAKFLSSFTSSLFLVSLTLILPVILSFTGYNDWGIVGTSYLGVILCLLAYTSVGIFCSTLTKNQIVAAILSFSFLMGIWLLLLSANLSTNLIVKQLVAYLTISYHFESFSRGAIRSYDLLYFFSFVTIFSYLGLRSLISRRW